MTTQAGIVATYAVRRPEDVQVEDIILALDILSAILLLTTLYLLIRYIFPRRSP